MSEHDEQRVLRLLENIENDLRTLRQLVGGGQSSADGSTSHAAPVGFAPAPVGFRTPTEDDGIEGIFDGEHMVAADGKAYQVSANYASKSKLVEGDPLKLYITGDGKFFYKQLGPIPRAAEPGSVQAEGNHYVGVTDEGKRYNILTASVTYFMSVFGLIPGGRVMLLLPEGNEATARYAAIDNLL